MVMAAIPTERLRLLVFDLDGTLIDSQKDLAQSINAMLRHFGRHEQPDAMIRSYIGDGANMLVRRALGDPSGDAQDDAFVAEAFKFFVEYYHVHKLDYTYVYDGVFDALKAIRAARPELKMACLTNKPVNPSRGDLRALRAGCLLLPELRRQQLSYQEARSAGAECFDC